MLLRLSWRPLLMSIDDIVATMFEKRVRMGEPMSKISQTVESLPTSNSDPSLDTPGKRMGMNKKQTITNS